MVYHKAFKKNKNNENNSGFLNVSKRRDKYIKKGYSFSYKMNNHYIKVNLKRKDLIELRNEVVENNLHWVILNKSKALETCICEKINPMMLNSNINSHYIQFEFSRYDFVEFIHTICSHGCHMIDVYYDRECSRC